jgi:hypothetical protein
MDVIDDRSNVAAIAGVRDKSLALVDNSAPRHSARRRRNGSIDDATARVFEAMDEQLTSSTTLSPSRVDQH